MTEPTVIDTPEGVQVFAFLQVWHALHLQRDTGLTHSRGSIIKLAQRRYGVRSRTAAGVIEELRPIYDALGLGKKS